MEDWKDLFFFMASTLTSNVSLYKSFLFDSKTMKNLIKEAFLHDNSVQKSHYKIKEDLEKHGNVCTKFLMIYITIFLCILFSLYAGCVILYLMSLKCDGHIEVCERSLVWPSLSIFSLETHYGLSLFVHGIGMTYLGVFVLTSNVTLASLCIFPTFKLKHLQNVLANFQYYAEISSKSLNISLREAEYYVVRECIIEHQKIISQFGKLKKNTQTLFLVDFITRALQTAPYLVILMASDGHIDYVLIMTISCMAFVLFELLMIYWFAQMIVDESINIGTSISLSNWYESDTKTLKLIHLLMVRSNRHLALKVGPFYEMDLQVFLKIFKGMYSVVMIFQRNT
ncbi:uncharacterized protein LOC123670733 [Harmonia axyridis]|uniref:uncharacterized protein LOC123670733 n=1 Tax=Harmonia axyridis TaxID=115357 RepID=UPI001E279897|nr:uncharacterized protein LOC123670733 [Harmonia axyridis]